MSFFFLLVRLLTAVVYLSLLVLCDSSTPEGFIFPSISNPEVPEVCDITVRNNDSMVVVFNLASTNAFDLAFNCTSSVQDAIDFEKNGGWMVTLSQGPYENTGKVLWKFDWPDFILQQNLTFCRFVLFNETLESCAWGPWGLVSWVDPYPNFTPLYFSPIFQIEAYNAAQQEIIWNDSAENGTSSDFSSSPIATSVISVTCPPSGIPPTPTPTPTWHTDNHPPLAEGLQFPVQQPF